MARPMLSPPLLQDLFAGKTPQLPVFSSSDDLCVWIKFSFFKEGGTPPHLPPCGRHQPCRDCCNAGLYNIAGSKQEQEWEKGSYRCRLSPPLPSQKSTSWPHSGPWLMPFGRHRSFPSQPPPPLWISHICCHCRCSTLKFQSTSPDQLPVRLLVHQWRKGGPLHLF